MKTILTFLLLITTVTITAQLQPVDSRKQQIAITEVNIIPMDSERIIENQTVIVENGRITAIGNYRKFRSDVLVVDGKGKYLMPGLGEIHAHVPPVDDLAPMKEVMMLFALNGVTTIRGMLGHPRHLELRSKVQSGEILGPRFYTSGPSFNGNTVKSATAGADMVRAQKAAGYDFLKLHPGLTKENFAAIAQSAKEVNIPFAGHVSWDVGVWRAIDAGYASIDHLDGFVESLVPGLENIPEQQAGPFAMFIAKQADTTRIAKLMTELRTHNIWVVPTQSLAERWFSPEKDAAAFSRESEMKYMAPNTLQNWINSKNNITNNPNYNATDIRRFVQLRRQLINACNKQGVGLLLGSDAPQIFNVPGFSLHHELRYLVDAGLTPYEALRTGTVNVARYFKTSGEQGVVKQGAVADLVLLNGNPLKDIDQTRNIEGVMLNGKWLSKTYIEQELKKLEKK